MGKVTSQQSSFPIEINLFHALPSLFNDYFMEYTYSYNITFTDLSLYGKIYS